MDIAYIAVTCLAIAAHLMAASFDFLKVGFVVETSKTVRVPLSWFPYLAWLKVFGAGGLLVGLLGWDALGLAAAIALVLYYVGAVGCFVRVRIMRNSSAAIGYLVLAVVTLVVTVWR